MNNQQVIGNIILESSYTSEPKLISEVNGKVEATGIIQDLGIENRNGRIYEEKDMKPEIEGDRIQKELLPTLNFKGEDGHPCTSELSRQSVVDPKCTSVLFTKIWLEGNDVHANFRGTNTQYGLALDADLKEGAKPSFSLRALGSVEREKNGKCYVRNIRIVTWDRVYFPSHKRAYTTGLINAKTEGKSVHESANLINGVREQNYMDCNTIDVVENGILIPIVNQQVVDYIKQESANVKSILNTFDTLYESAIIVNGGKQVQLQLNGGDKILVNLEQYIEDEILNYCMNN